MAEDQVQIGGRVPLSVGAALREAYGTPAAGATAVLVAWARHRADLPETVGEDPLDAVLTSWRTLVTATWRELRGRFSTGELNLVLDVLNGCATLGALAGQHLVAECEDGIALNRYDLKHEVDAAAFRERLHALSTWERYCVELWAAQWWATPGFDAASEEARRVFRALAGAEGA